MKSSETPLDLAGILSGAVLEWVEGRGWRRRKFARDDIAVLEKSRTQVSIPLDAEFRDYARRLEEAIEVIADVENMPAIHLVRTLLIKDTDALNWRGAKTAIIRAGTLPLNDGIAFFEGARKMLLSSAHMRIDPASFYRRLGSQKAAEAFIERCRMGPTEEGSFVATIFCPVNVELIKIPEQMSLLTGLGEPFGRAVTRTLMTQMSRLAEAAAKNDGDLLFEGENRTARVSANFCEGLLRMTSNGSINEISVSAEWNGTPPKDTAAIATISYDEFHVVEGFVKVLRPEFKEPNREVFTGKVRKLEADPEKDKRSGGEITVAAVTQAFGNVNAKLMLETTDDYHLALKAHDASDVVVMSGRIVKTGRGYRILEYSDFRLLNDRSSE
jgi:hypothetical protein